ncbi:hypothetical protein ACH518_07845 [Methylomonas sp. HW2-6]|uniref:hypothetical protein n=1 Tax=Methylomonas sp. HW2-6 TaxID=3376687 RepID=UPI0040410714
MDILYPPFREITATAVFEFNAGLGGDQAVFQCRPVQQRHRRYCTGIAYSIKRPELKNLQSALLQTVTAIRKDFAYPRTNQNRVGWCRYKPNRYTNPDRSTLEHWKLQNGSPLYTDTAK